MEVVHAIRTRRSIRLYRQTPIPSDTLRELVDAARLSPSCANLQPLQFIAVWDPEIAGQAFPTLTWAGVIAPQRDPPEGKRPVAYIVVLVDPRIHYFPADGHYDTAAAIENILLAAWGKGIGSCWVRRIDREELRRILRVPEHLEIDSVISLGYPAEHPVVEDVVGPTAYYLDDQGTLHVPKRRLCDILHENCYAAAAEDCPAP